MSRLQVPFQVHFKRRLGQPLPRESQGTDRAWHLARAGLGGAAEGVREGHPADVADYLRHHQQGPV